MLEYVDVEYRMQISMFLYGLISGDFRLYEVNADKVFT